MTSPLLSLYVSAVNNFGAFLLGRMFHLFSLPLLVVTLAQLAGCAHLSSNERWNQLLMRAHDEDFRDEVFKTQSFMLMGLIKGRFGASPELVVYLEGDGRGVVRGRVSQDPTPHTAMGYELARSDPAPAVLYLARVGQFQSMYNGPAYQAYWSEKRLAREAIEAAMQALDQAKAHLGARSLHLVGYSGGGGLALLLAGQRKDVLSVTTVAGLLDTHWWVQEKNFSPLTGSLNPADVADTLADLPQIHFFGRHDTIIPPAMSTHFQTLTTFTNFQRIAVDTNHWDRWPELWPRLLEEYLIVLRASSFDRLNPHKEADKTR